MNFRSDNESPVAAEIMAALERANAGYAHAYGADRWTAGLNALFAEVFETEVEVFPVATGTAANSLCIAQMTPPYGSAYCHEGSHLYADECGAPEFYSGGKLVPLPGAQALITPATLRDALARTGYHGDHESRPSALSITQATELGTVYTPEAITELARTAHEAGLGMHMDGARLGNAVVALDCSPAQTTWRAGVDMLSFGATKNGALAAEAVVVFNRDYAEALGRRRKRGGHLFSKMRYISVQLETYLRDGLWLALARRANDAARLLAEGFEAAGLELITPAQANEVFVKLPAGVAARMREAGFEFHPWPGTPDVYRFVTSHATDTGEVRRLVELAASGKLESSAA
jgi:threonine aldolase